MGAVADVLRQAEARGAPVDGLRQAFAERQALAYLRIIYGPEYTVPQNWSGCAGAAWAPSGR